MKDGGQVEEETEDDVDEDVLAAVVRLQVHRQRRDEKGEDDQQDFVVGHFRVVVSYFGQILWLAKT